MSESVYRHLESLVKELEELKRIGLYTNEETKLIIKSVNDFEYKINGVTKNQKDYEAYIKFLGALVKQIRLRRNKKRIAEKKNSIDYKILRKMKSLYEIEIQRFPSNLDLRQAYLKFCLASNFLSDANIAIENMTKTFPNDEKVWKISAQFHAKDRHDYHSALKVLHKGLTLNKESVMLYSEAVKITLAAIKNPQKDDDLKQLNAELATYIELICSNVTDYNFFIELLGDLGKDEFTAKARDIIIEKLRKDHSDQNLVWHTLAQRELEALPGNNSTEQGSGSGNSGTKINQEKYQKCFAIYEEGLRSVPENQKKDLWSLYLDFLFNIRTEDDRLKVFVTNHLVASLNAASSEGNLDEKYYIAWLQLVTDDKIETILEQGTTNIPNSIELWKLRLRYAILRDDPKRVNTVFKLGVIALTDRALPLWLMTLRFYMLMHANKIIEAIFCDAMKQPVNVRQALKPKFIEWVAVAKGMEEARGRYTELASSDPPCKELHNVMSRLESSEIIFNFYTWVKVHQLTCQQFGAEDVDVWINHILFYVNFHKGANLNQKVEEIYKEAEKNLNPLMLSEFREKYAQAIKLK